MRGRFRNRTRGRGGEPDDNDIFGTNIWTLGYRPNGRPVRNAWRTKQTIRPLPSPPNQVLDCLWLLIAGCYAPLGVGETR
jgi:hypothetical protein